MFKIRFLRFFLLLPLFFLLTEVSNVGGEVRATT